MSRKDFMIPIIIVSPARGVVGYFSSGWRRHEWRGEGRRAAGRRDGVRRVNVEVSCSPARNAGGRGFHVGFRKGPDEGAALGSSSYATAAGSGSSWGISDTQGEPRPFDPSIRLRALTCPWFRRKPDTINGFRSDKERGDALEGRAAGRQRRRPPGTGWRIRGCRCAGAASESERSGALVGGWLLGRQPPGAPRPDRGMGGGSGGAGARRPLRTAGDAAADPGARFVSTVLASTGGRMDRRSSAGEARVPAAQARDVQRTPPDPPAELVNRRRSVLLSEDQTVYNRPDFYQMLQQRFKAPGISPRPMSWRTRSAHHVQNLIGTMGEVQSQRQRDVRESV